LRPTIVGRGLQQVPKGVDIVFIEGLPQMAAHELQLKNDTEEYISPGDFDRHTSL